MFTAIFQQHYGYLLGCVVAALVLGGAAWLLSRRLGDRRGPWWAALAATLTGVCGVTFMDGGAAPGQCVVNHDPLEAFRATQGLWNLAMTVPLGFFALAAVRRPWPALVGVIALPPAIELTQGTVDGLGRVCDSADAQMNVLGGLAGLALAAAAFARRGSLAWRAGATPSLLAAVALLVLGPTLAPRVVAFTHVDGTGLSTAGEDQRRAVEQRVREAFGDRYALGPTYDQPCPGAPCRHVVFTLLSRDERTTGAFGGGTLSWPDGTHFAVMLQHVDEAGDMGYPVPGTEPPSDGREASEVARAYVRRHHPWAQAADVRETYPVGESGARGWTTVWRWRDGGVLMPRALEVRLDGAGRVAEVDVRQGPTSLDLPEPKLGAAQAEDAVRRAVTASSRNRGAAPPDGLRIEAYGLKATERDGTWGADWIVGLREGSGSRPVDPFASAATSDTWRVDAVTGRVHDSAGAPVPGS